MIVIILTYIQSLCMHGIILVIYIISSLDPCIQLCVVHIAFISIMQMENPGSDKWPINSTAKF